MSQSPIHLKTSEALTLREPELLFKWLSPLTTRVRGEFEGEHGHGNFVVRGNGTQIEFRGEVYELKKIHIHSASEHIVDQDELHDLEIHFVHAPLRSKVMSPLVAIGVLFKIHCDAVRSKDFGQLRHADHGQKCSLVPANFLPRLSESEAPDTQNWFHYEGSLTSFPYSENVSWIVMSKTSHIHEEDVADLQHAANQVARPLQPLLRRLIVRSFPDSAESPS